VTVVAAVILFSSGVIKASNVCRINYKMSPGVTVTQTFAQLVDCLDDVQSYRIISEGNNTVVAEHTTSFWKYVDDVFFDVIRMETAESGNVTVIEAYSHSRVGKSDFGQNYKNLNLVKDCFVSMAYEVDEDIVEGCTFY